MILSDWTVRLSFIRRVVGGKEVEKRWRRKSRKESTKRQNRVASILSPAHPSIHPSLDPFSFHSSPRRPHATASSPQFWPRTGLEACVCLRNRQVAQDFRRKRVGSALSIERDDVSTRLWEVLPCRFNSRGRWFHVSRYLSSPEPQSFFLSFTYSSPSS